MCSAFPGRWEKNSGKGNFRHGRLSRPGADGIFRTCREKGVHAGNQKICDGRRKGCGGRCPLRIRQATSHGGIQPADPGLWPADKTVSPFADPHDNAVSEAHVDRASHLITGMPAAYNGGKKDLRRNVANPVIVALNWRFGVRASATLRHGGKNERTERGADPGLPASRPSS